MSQLVKYQDSKELSVAKIIESNTLPIALLKKEDAKSLQINLSAFMIEFSSIYKIDDSKNLSDEEIKTCVNILLTDYYWLKYEDFAMFLKNARMGKYGKIYGSFDTPTFFQMLTQYCDERVEVSKEINRVAMEKEARTPISPETQALIDDFKKQLQEKKVKRMNFSDEIPEMREQQKQMNKYISEFKKKVGHCSGFLEINGKMLGINEYLELRYNEEKEL